METSGAVKEEKVKDIKETPEKTVDDVPKEKIEGENVSNRWKDQ